MSDDSTVGTADDSPSVGRRMKKGFESKILIPAAVAVVSAAASYLVKKLPMILEEKVLPKLREQGAPETVQDVLQQASGALGGLSSEVSRETGRNGDTPEESSSASRESERTSGAEAPSKSNDEREEERRQREKRRRERKRSHEKAA